MGLDISAYARYKLVKAADKYNERERPQGDCAFFYTTEDWLACKGFIKGWYGPAEGHDFVEHEHSFRAGSYGHYNWWREQLSLCMLGARPEYAWAHEQEVADNPFSLLVCFSDCEGTITSESCKVLHKAFVDNRKKALAWAKKTDGEFMRNYDDFTKAFELGADRGLVKFH